MKLLIYYDSVITMYEYIVRF